MSAVPGCWGVIPAAGSGRRMGSALPKQYLEIAGRTLLEHSAAALLAVPGLAGLVVACAPRDTRCRELPGLPDERVSFVHGGARRCDSVLAALRSLRERAAPRDWILVHDAARPCVDGADIRRLLDAVRGAADGGLLATPLVDTAKQVDRDGRVVATLDRSVLWRAQTPQAFPFAALLQGLEQALDAGIEVTDEASAMEWRGHGVRVVQGSPLNIKVTCPDDLALAACILARRGQRAPRCDGEQ